MKNVFLVFALFCFLTAGAQSTDKSAAMKALVESHNYVFQAQTALPLHGQVRQLTSEYDLKVTPEKVVSDLPYFGRAYTAIDPAKNPMDFITKSFDYTMTPQKKGGWEITIKPKDLKDDDVQQVYLSISKDGYATVRVISANRDAISYNGSIISGN